MGRKNNFSESEKVADKVFTIIEWCLVAVIVGCFFIHWKLGIAAFVFLIWSEYWYAHGAEKWETDEYERGGYPVEGLKTMFKSWVCFVGFAAVIFYFFW